MGYMLQMLFLSNHCALIMSLPTESKDLNKIWHSTQIRPCYSIPKYKLRKQIKKQQSIAYKRNPNENSQNSKCFNNIEINIRTKTPD